MKKPYFYTTLSILTVATLAFCFVPLPHSVICPLEIQVRDAQSIYVDVAGNLLAIDVKQGQRVAEGQPLAQLGSHDLDIEVSKLQGNVNEYQMKLMNLRRQSFRDRHAMSSIPAVQEALATAKNQLREKKADQRRLRLVAPTAGMVMPPPVTPHRDDPDERLPTWSGTPLDRDNLGAFLEQGVLFCQIGDPKKLEVSMVVDQTDRNYLREGQQVDIKLEGFPFVTLHSEIEEIAGTALKVSPKRLSTKSGGELPTKTNPQTGAEEPISATYQARAPIDDPAGQYRIGLRGQARVHTRWISLGTRLWRLITHTFNFKLS